MKPTSKSFDNKSPLPRPSSVSRRSANMPSERPYLRKSEMHLPEGPYTPAAESMCEAVADEVADDEVAEETDARSTDSHMPKWTTIPPKDSEGKHALKMSQPTVIQTPPRMTNKDTTSAVSRDTSSPTSSTSTVPWMNTTKSIMAHHLRHLLQQ